MSDDKKANRPGYQLVAPPAAEGGIWAEVGVAWERTDKDGSTYFSVFVPLLGRNLLLRTKKYFNDDDAPKSGAKFKARKAPAKQATVDDDDLPF